MLIVDIVFFFPNVMSMRVEKESSELSVFSVLINYLRISCQVDVVLDFVYELDFFLENQGVLANLREIFRIRSNYLGQGSKFQSSEANP